MARNEAARRGCDHARANVHASGDRNSLARGYLFAALAYAATFGVILAHWAVVA